MSLVEHWPLFGLRITTPRLELRIPTDDDLAEIIQVAGAGIHDPVTMPFTTAWTDVPSPRFEREALQYWWRGRAELSPERWELGFVVAHNGRLVGVQSLSSTDFPLLRTAETGSWIGQEHQGAGIGKEMRAAVAHFAFEHLGALDITSAAFIDNPASRKVSEAVGYELNGTTYATRRGERAELTRFVLTRERWQRVRPETPTTVTGFDGCRDQLGLTEQ